MATWVSWVAIYPLPELVLLNQPLFNHKQEDTLAQDFTKGNMMFWFFIAVIVAMLLVTVILLLQILLAKIAGRNNRK